MNTNSLTRDCLRVSAATPLHHPAACARAGSFFGCFERQAAAKQPSIGAIDRQALAHTEADNTRLCDGYVTGVPPPPSGPPPGAAFGVPPPPPQGQPLSMGGSQGDSRPQNLPHSASAFSALALNCTRTIHVHAHLVSHFLVCLPRSLANKSDLEQLHKDQKANPRAAPRSNRRRHWALSPLASARFEPAWLNARFDPTLGVLSCRAVHRAAARVTHVSISPVPPHPTPPHRLWGRYTIGRRPAC